MFDFEKMKELIEDLQFKKEAYLRKHGWNMSCSNPASIWLWEKTMSNGKTLALTSDMAIDMQSYIEH